MYFLSVMTSQWDVKVDPYSCINKNHYIFHDDSETNGGIIIKLGILMSQAYVIQPINIGVGVVYNDIVKFEYVSKF